jgi:hypothetical protein
MVKQFYFCSSMRFVQSIVGLVTKSAFVSFATVSERDADCPSYLHNDSQWVVFGRYFALGQIHSP